jgi:hypothetical protein
MQTHYSACFDGIHFPSCFWSARIQSSISDVLVRKSAQRSGSACATRNGFSEVLRSCAMDLASRAWERGVSGREDCSVQVPSLVLISDADVIGNES